MLNNIMIFYFSFYLIPRTIAGFVGRSDHIFVYIPGIIFCIGMCLYRKYIDEISYPIAAFTYIIWIIFSRFHFALLVSGFVNTTTAWKAVLFWGIFIGFTYHKLHIVFGKDCVHDFIDGYNEIKSRIHHIKTNEKTNKDNSDHTYQNVNSENAKKESSSDSNSDNSNRKGENWETFRKRYSVSEREAAEKFFENCKTEDERKVLYHKLMKIYHPDEPTGNAELCKAIKDVYEHR